MRSSVLLLPLLLVISPGDGAPRHPVTPAPEEVWNPLRPWQHVPADSADTLRSRLVTGLTRNTVPDGKPVEAGKRNLLACPMPVHVPSKPAVLPPLPMPPRDSLRADSAFAMPIVPSGCWNPLFLHTR
jgi:hypothetical protein